MSGIIRNIAITAIGTMVIGVLLEPLSRLISPLLDGLHFSGHPPISLFGVLLLSALVGAPMGWLSDKRQNVFLTMGVVLIPIFSLSAMADGPRSSRGNWAG